VTLAQNVINLFYVSYIDKVKIPAGWVILSPPFQSYDSSLLLFPSSKMFVKIK
jgi:hypothetical protein